MKPGGYFELKLSTGQVITLLLTMRAIEIFCERRDCDIDFFDSFFDEKSKAKIIEQTKVYRQIVSAAIAAAKESKNEAIDFNDSDVDIWMTDAGGYFGEQVQTLIKGFFKALNPGSEFSEELKGEDQGQAQTAA